MIGVRCQYRKKQSKQFKQVHLKSGIEIVTTTSEHLFYYVTKKLHVGNSLILQGIYIEKARSSFRRGVCESTVPLGEQKEMNIIK